jgi:hypothetical protein
MKRKYALPPGSLLERPCPTNVNPSHLIPMPEARAEMVDGFNSGWIRLEALVREQVEVRFP